MTKSRAEKKRYAEWKSTGVYKCPANLFKTGLAKWTYSSKSETLRAVKRKIVKKNRSNNDQTPVTLQIGFAKYTKTDKNFGYIHQKWLNKGFLLLSACNEQNTKEENLKNERILQQEIVALQLERVSLLAVYYKNNCKVYKFFEVIPCRTRLSEETFLEKAKKLSSRYGQQTVFVRSPSEKNVELYYRIPSAWIDAVGMTRDGVIWH